ncbi:copper chaperone PCu(A)C [Glycomyces tenuis]|uniref:copper chaperone PCu(A)C n=1 Tax=Glycomyces tenuis TaxID=58116 RepID=UPI000420D42B|nr:copper chaperone PCu(A)C [Glycomyces tenuis]
MARGISTATIARRAAALAIAAAAATGLSACGAGQVTQTDTKQTAIAGVNTDEGELSLRDLQVEYSAEGYEAGGTAPLRLWIANNGDEPVSLVGIETDAAEGVTLVDGGEPGVDVEETTEAPESEATSEAPTGGEETTDGATEETTEQSTDEATDGATEQATDEATEGATEEPAAEPTEAESPALGFEPIEITPGGFVRLDQGVEDGDHLVLEGLAEPLMPGENITVTFVFSNGQEFPVEIPVTQPQVGDEDDRTYMEHPGPAH